MIIELIYDQKTFLNMLRLGFKGASQIVGVDIEEVVTIEDAKNATKIINEFTVVQPT